MADKKDIGFPLPLRTSSGQPVILRVGEGPDGEPRATLAGLHRVEHGHSVPPQADLVRVRDRGGHYEMETMVEAQIKSSGGRGWKPMKVSRKTFETNWDRIFGGKAEDTTVN